MLSFFSRVPLYASRTQAVLFEEWNGAIWDRFLVWVRTLDGPASGDAFRHYASWVPSGGFTSWGALRILSAPNLHWPYRERACFKAASLREGAGDSAL